MPRDLASALKDKDFLTAQPADQMAYLSSIDPDFAKASPQDQGEYLNHILAPARAARARTETAFEKERKPEGTALWRGAKAVGEDIASAAGGIGNAISTAGLGGAPAAAVKQAVDFTLADQARREKGYSPLYRGAAGLGTIGGVNVEGMEEAAEHGDTAGIAGHTVLPLIGAAAGADQAITGGRGMAAARGVLPKIGEGGIGLAESSKVRPVARLILGRDRAEALSELMRRGTPDVTPIGGASLPSSEEFYSQRGEELDAIRERSEALDRQRAREAQANKPSQVEPFAGGTSTAKPIGHAELPTIPAPVSAGEVEPIVKAETPAVKPIAKAETPAAPRQVPVKIDEIVNQAMGVKPLQPNVPLREQVTPIEGQDPLKAKYPDPAVRQMVRANGEEVVEATKGDPKLMKAVHDLTRVDLRQALINSGEDMGQMTVSNSKFAGEGSIGRHEAFRRLLAKGYGPEQIIKLANPPSYKPSEKAELMSGEQKKFGPEFEEGQRSAEIDRNKKILRNPKATDEDREIAQSRLDDLSENVIPLTVEETSPLTAQRLARARASKIREARQ
jgi:hypothetical protein